MKFLHFQLNIYFSNKKMLILFLLLFGLGCRLGYIFTNDEY